MSKYLKYFTILFFLCVYHAWLIPGTILTKGDWPYYFTETLIQIRQYYFSLWSPDGELGRFLIDVAQAPTYALGGLLGRIGLGWDMSERLIYMWPIILFAPIGTYLLLSRFFKTEQAKISGCFVFCFNTYFLALQTGQLTLGAALALMPIVFLTFLESLEKGGLRNYAFAAISLELMMAYEPRMAYIMVFLLFFYYLWDLFSFEGLTIQIFLKKSVNSAVPVVFLLLINIYWILGFKHVGNFVDGSILTRGLWGGNYYDVGRAFTIFHPWWTGSEMAVFKLQPTPPWLYLGPIFAILGLYTKKTRIVVFAGLTGILGIFLTKQEVAPLPDVYYWLFKHFPGFAAFREASKFYSLVTFSYSILIAAFVEHIWTDSVNRFNWKANVLVNGIIIFIFALNALPLLTGAINSLFVQRNIPNDYVLLKQYIEDQDEEFRTLYVPATPRWAYSDIKHLNINLVGMNASKWDSFLPESDLNQIDPVRIVAPLELKIAPNLLSAAGIKYLVIPLRDVNNSDNIFIDYGERNNPDIRKWYIDQLDTLPYLRRVDIGTKDLLIYEFVGYRKRVFTFPSLTELDSVKNIDGKYQAVSLTPDDFFFVKGPLKFNPENHVQDLFENIDVSDLQAGSVVSRVDSILRGASSTAYLIRTRPIVGPGELRMDNVLLADESLQVLQPADIPKENYGLQVASQFRFSGSGLDFHQLFADGSFENGPWTDIVGDCNHHDDYPDLGMAVVHDIKSEFSSYLELEARRHIACTNKHIDIDGGGAYLLGFNYRSPNSEQASFHIGFNDFDRLSIYRSMPIENSEWNRYVDVVKAPIDSTVLTLDLYSRESNGITKNINHYANFSLIKIPDIQQQFYLLTNINRQNSSPEISHKYISASKKLITIKNAHTPFYVGYSEAFHPQWRLLLKNDKVEGKLNSWFPMANGDLIPDSMHFKLDDFLNGWFVDPVSVCLDHEVLRQGCVRNADGSFDIQMVIEFWPERWLRLGSIVSLSSVLILVIFVITGGWKLDTRKK